MPFIRDRRPSRYHEIGSGHSTLLAARAVRDGELETRILSVERAGLGGEVLAYASCLWFEVA